MIVDISGDAEEDVVEGYWFYERQAQGVGGYFRDSIIADIDSLEFFGGIHEVCYGHHRMPAKRFPFSIYYDVIGDTIIVMAVLDARRNPSWIRNRLG